MKNEETPQDMLDDAARKYADITGGSEKYKKSTMLDFKAGANWREKQERAKQSDDTVKMLEWMLSNNLYRIQTGNGNAWWYNGSELTSSHLLTKWSEYKASLTTKS